MPVISSIILIARIVAAVGGGGLILAWRLRTQHFNHFPFARRLRLRRNSNSVCDTLRMPGTARCSHPRGLSITTLESRAAPAQEVEPQAAILTYAVPAVPKRPIPATPAVGPLSSESTVPTLRR